MRIEPDVRPLLPEIRVPCLVARYAGELSHSPEAIDQIQRFCEHVTRAGGRSASRPRRHSGRSPESSG
jgi:hypothetical protein